MRPALWIVLMTGALAAEQQPVFRTHNETVAIYATVESRDGHLVPNLDREAFTILDEGRPVELTVFSNDLKPITAVLMLDLSGSMLSRVKWMRDATLSFVDALGPDERLAIGWFGERISLRPGLTGDKPTLRATLTQIRPSDGSAVWRAIDEGMDVLQNESGRRAVVILTDGNNTQHIGVDDGDIKRRAIAEGVMVYAVGVNDKGLSPQIRAISEETGGGHVELNVAVNLSAALARVAEELRHQYLLGFTPEVTDGKVHQLSVRAQTSAGTFRVRTPRSYVARKPAP